MTDAEPVALSSNPRTRAWPAAVLIIALAYAAYLGLLVTCDWLRVPSLGFRADFLDRSMLVRDVTPGGLASQAGLLAGDRITRANGQEVEGRTDWLRVRVHVDPAEPLQLRVTRPAGAIDLALEIDDPRALAGARPPPIGLVTFRLVQIVTLAFAILVGSKRWSQPSALLGAVLLASIAVISLVLPMRLALFWERVPWVLRGLLWIPFATSFAVGPLLFAFFAVFPRRTISRRMLTLALLPGLLPVAYQLYVGATLMRPLGPATDVADWTIWIFGVNIAYAVLAVMQLMSRHDREDTVTDRRRTRVLLVGTSLGVGAGAAAIARYWWSPWDDIFASQTMTGLALMFLAAPASFTYAILRHRLFDIRLIVRQGLRYAFARRFVDALIPALAVVLMVDIVVHRAQPVSELLRSRGWWYALLGGALWVARARHQDWLYAIDRRFFRERYDARRLLNSIAGQISRATSLEAIAPAVLRQIDEALHPEFADVLRYFRSEAMFANLGPGIAETVVKPLPASLAVIGVLTVLRKPLALSQGDTAWVRHQLPGAERSLLVERHIEVLVPVPNERPGELPLALLVLGPRRSEEPYNSEDLDLLARIAQAVGSLMERSGGSEYVLAECETCGRCFDAGTTRCDHDQTVLSTVYGTRLLNQRYRLERRLGRGGMGTVYQATDDVLERRVAVKLIREDVASPIDLPARFRQEAKAAAAFAHPHVVRVYDFGIDACGRPFLVMELLEGATLRERLLTGVPLETDATLHVLRALCTALSAAHSRGLVHRDLKPENIFLHRHGDEVVPKVLDFGLAKAFQLDPVVEWETRVRSTDGVVVGTLPYMAPEQIAGGEVHPRWDLWATSVIAYEMLTCIHPFRRALTFKPGARLIDAPSATTALDVNPRAPHLTDAVTALFRSALSTEASQRPADALSLLRACEQAMQ